MTKAQNPRQLADALDAAETDIEDALVHLLSMSDQLRRLNAEDLSIEAARLTLSQTYLNLVEAVFKRLVNILLSAKFILEGRHKPYSDIADMSLNNKEDTLEKARDSRYSVALLGVVRTSRNAGAHGDIDLSGRTVLLRDFDPRTKRESVEELTDEEFASRLLDLVHTCFALRLSVELLRIHYQHSLPAAHLPTKRRLIVEAARTVVGLWGLREAQVTANLDEEEVTVEVTDPSVGDPRVAEDYLVPASVLATFFHEWRQLELRVNQTAGQHRLVLLTSDAQQALSPPEELKALGALRLRYRCRPESELAGSPERYITNWIRPCATIVLRDLAELRRLNTGSPADKNAMLAKAKVLLLRMAAMTKMVKDVMVPTNGMVAKDRLLAGLSLVAKGLRNLTISGGQSRSGGVWHPPEVLYRGLRIITELAT